MRPMRLGKREIKGIENLRMIIEQCEVVRLGFTDEEGMFIVPVNFGYELKEEETGEVSFVLYFHGAREGRKAEAIAADPRAAIEMDCRHELIRGDYTCSYSYAYQSIMGNGIVRELTGREEKIHGLTRIMEHLDPGAEIAFSDEMLKRTGVFAVEVKTFTGKERRAKS